MSDFRSLDKQFLMDTRRLALAPQVAVGYRPEEWSEQCCTSVSQQKSRRRPGPKRPASSFFSGLPYYSKKPAVQLHAFDRQIAYVWSP